MVNIIYLHGFASTGNSSKVDALKATFGQNHKIHSPTLSENPEKAIEQISNLIRDIYYNENDSQFILVGTSLGGFYASYIGIKFDIPVVLINPSIQPHNTLSSKVGKVLNYGTGELFDFKVSYLEKLEEYYCEIVSRKHELNATVIVAKDDDVIPYRDTIEFYKNKEIHVFDTGGHRMENFNEVLKILDKML